ncbi:MAG: indole-3-glycerol phosphate synthase TrpC [Nonlabens sp.]
MIDILKKITDQTRKDLELRKRSKNLSDLRSMPFYERTPYSLSKSLKTGSGIIAEHKRQSPSKGSFDCPSDLAAVVRGYEQAGASAISCLTDQPFFGGSLEDLLEARKHVSIPLLRKDFMIDLYQVHESKALGADAILLIAACLNDELIQTLSSEAINLGLSILYEVHDLEELERIKSLTQNYSVDHFVIGVNNRDLKVFKTDIQNSKNLLPHFPKNAVAVSESGISDPVVVQDLKKSGYKGFLIGEHFMKSQDPGAACAEFIKNVNHAD